jgi:hypothetical protein
MLNQGKDYESTSLVKVEKMVKPFKTYHSAMDKKNCEEVFKQEASTMMYQE